MSDKRYSVVDLFSGVGGLSYGFYKLPAFKVVLANEADEDTAAAYLFNHPRANMLVGDIRDIPDDALLGALDGRKADVLLGGPYCPVQAVRRGEAAYARYMEVLGLLRPAVFVLENVARMRCMDGGSIYRKAVSAMHAMGYSLHSRSLDAADYGVPQHRVRVFMVGTLGLGGYEFPEPTHGNGRRPHVTLGEAFGDLPALAAGETGTAYTKEPDGRFLRFVRRPGSLTEHTAPRCGDRMRRIMEALGDGQTRDDLPEDIRAEAGANKAYGKLWWDQPSVTVTRAFALPAVGRCIHPRDSRALSIREGARLQSFPDDYRFHGSLTQRRIEIGEATPPLLSLAIAKQVLAALEGG